MHYFANFVAFAVVQVESFVLLRCGATCQKSEYIVYDFVCTYLSTSDIEKYFKISDGTFI